MFPLHPQQVRSGLQSQKAWRSNQQQRRQESQTSGCGRRRTKARSPAASTLADRRAVPTSLQKSISSRCLVDRTRRRRVTASRTRPGDSPGRFGDCSPSSTSEPQNAPDPSDPPKSAHGSKFGFEQLRQQKVAGAKSPALTDGGLLMEVRQLAAAFLSSHALPGSMGKRQQAAALQRLRRREFRSWWVVGLGSCDDEGPLAPLPEPPEQEEPRLLSFRAVSGVSCRACRERSFRDGTSDHLFPFRTSSRIAKPIITSDAT
jgi:hypothetical protein